MKKIFHRLCFSIGWMTVGVLVLYGSPVQAETAVSQTITELEQIALTHHPVLLAKQQRITSLNGQWIQEGLAPNPEIGYAAEEITSGNMGKQGVEFSQEIVTRQKLAHAQEVVCREIEVAKESLKIAEWKVRTDVRVAAFAFLVADRKNTLHQELVQINESIYQMTESLYGKGEVTKLDLLNMGMELEKSRTELVSAQNDREAAWKELACVLGTPDMAPVTITDSLECQPHLLPWEDFAQVLLETSPEIARAQAAIQQAQKKLELENARNSSNITVGGGVMYNTESHATQVGLGVSVPLRIRDRNQGNIASARSEVLAAHQEYERILLSVQQRLADVYRRYASACENLQKYRDKILPKAKESLQLARSGYEHGELNYLDLLNSQQTFAGMYLLYLDNLEEYWTYKTILEGKLLTGCLEDGLE